MEEVGVSVKAPVEPFVKEFPLFSTSSPFLVEADTSYIVFFLFFSNDLNFHLWV